MTTPVGAYFSLLPPWASWLCPPGLTSWSWEGITHGAPSKGNFKTSGPQFPEFRTASEWSLVALLTPGLPLRPSVSQKVRLMRASPDPAALKHLTNTQRSASASLISLGSSWPAMVQNTFSPMGLPVQGPTVAFTKAQWCQQVVKCLWILGFLVPPSRVCCSIFKPAVQLFVKRCSPLELYGKFFHWQASVVSCLISKEDQGKPDSFRAGIGVGRWRFPGHWGWQEGEMVL